MNKTKCIFSYYNQDINRQCQCNNKKNLISYEILFLLLFFESYINITVISNNGGFWKVVVSFYKLKRMFCCLWKNTGPNQNLKIKAKILLHHHKSGHCKYNWVLKRLKLETSNSRIKLLNNMVEFNLFRRPL